MSDEQARSLRFAGGIGTVATVAVALVLLVHPFGSTALYDDGQRFLDHVDGFWITLHLVGATILLAFPVVIDTWARALASPEARVAGRAAGLMTLLGMAVGAIHLVGTDTMTWVFFGDTAREAAGTEATTTVVDLLLRLHAATLFAWVLTFWLGVPALVAVAARLDGRLPSWFVGLGAVAAVLQVAALAVTASAEQWTTLSEQVLFRSGATLTLVLFLLLSVAMRRTTVEQVSPRRQPEVVTLP